MWIEDPLNSQRARVDANGRLLINNIVSREEFTALNPTPGTGIAQSIQTTFSATNGILAVRNTETDDEKGRAIIPISLRLINTVVGASTTRSEGLIALDTTSRYASGGSTLTGLKTNLHESPGSIADIRFGALTLNAEGAGVRRASRFQLRTSIMVQFEEWIIGWAGPSGQPPQALNVPSGNNLSAANAQRNVTIVPAMILAPSRVASNCLVVHLWNPGNAATAPSWEVEFVWAEMPINQINTV